TAAAEAAAERRLVAQRLELPTKQRVRRRRARACRSWKRTHSNARTTAVTRIAMLQLDPSRPRERPAAGTPQRRRAAARTARAQTTPRRAARPRRARPA